MTTALVITGIILYPVFIYAVLCLCRMAKDD